MTNKGETEMFCDVGEFDSDNVKLVPDADVRTNYQERRCTRLCFMTLLFFSVVLVTCGAIYLYVNLSIRGELKNYVESVSIRYHEWKTAANGDRKGFLMEGEYYQQVEIDIARWEYERLSVPSVMNSRPVVILHDFSQMLTSIVDRDHGRCFILPINTTLVKPVQDYFDMIRNIKAGYFALDGEVIHAEYKVEMPAITDVAQFGINILQDCAFFDVYRITLDTHAHDMVRRSAADMCVFEGERYCLGNAGVDFMLFLQLSRCN